MTTKSQLHAILSKKMNRQDFLKHVALGIVALTGVGTALRLLSSDSKSVSTAQGYGASAYGGKSKENIL